MLSKRVIVNDLPISHADFSPSPSEPCFLEGKGDFPIRLGTLPFREWSLSKLNLVKGNDCSSEIFATNYLDADSQDGRPTKSLVQETKSPSLFRYGFRRIFVWSLLIFCVAAAMPSSFAASNATGVQLNVSLGDLNAPKELSTSLQLFLLFTVLTLAPSIVIMMTSFTRIVVVLSFLRSALGIQQPSSQILVGLSLFLTAFIMYPVWVQIDQEAITPLRENKLETSAALERAVVPIKQFMLKYTRQKDLELFMSMSAAADKQTANANANSNQKVEPGLQSVIPAFMISELRTAFQMGFVVFLPFLVIDIVVSSILMAMGMMMLPPAMVTLPLKILVFVLADGWSLIVRSLVLSFQ
jgi:flagellar biosynthetic protein FliP